ncbi:unnamed protein product [Cladocopium goreaui]|uniref:PA14 domain-containing protein n=1 Tax=Cladocopium goreaui TaxID=2562237 RepID=A0A9P1DC64_9DINO|nr:unnamed protein product [Cladocopium goreaui]
MKLLALAAVTLHGLASKVPKNQLLELDEGLNLRGHSGKKVQSPTLPTLDSDIYPVAPQDQLAAGVQAAGAQSPPGSALPRYHRKEEQAPNAFPETASKAGRQVLLTYSVNQENKFMLTLQEGPDAHGVYTILWADSGVASSAVHAMHMRLPSLLLRMHWEASDFRWRSNALSEIKKEVLPDEVAARTPARYCQDCIKVLQSPPQLPQLHSNFWANLLGDGLVSGGKKGPVGHWTETEEMETIFGALTSFQAPEVLRGQQLECHDSPHGWQDSNGNDCYQYKKGEWCSSSGSGAGWKDSWGSFVEWSNSMAGNGPEQACCACGGGVKLLASVVSHLDGRLQAPQDGFDEGGMAPADRLPEEFMDSDPVTAPLDQIPAKFAHYLTSVDKKRQQPDVMGLSARFYSVKPTDDCNGPAPMSSTIDRALDYRFGFTGGFQRFLQLHAKHADSGSFFYGKWTGTINILEKGKYVFDLDLGFDTSSSIKIDGQELLTHGQCKASKEAYSCAQKRCLWLDGNCMPPSGAAGSAPAPAPAVAVAAAAAPGLEWPRLVPERQSDVMSPWHNAAALGLLQAPSPATAPGAAAAPAPVPMAMAPVPAPMAAVPVPVPAPAPPPFEAEGKPGEMLLSVGGHCVEVLVRADSNSRSIQLSYNGPDTGHVKTVVPGQVLFCDPVVPACVSPELSSCKSSTCGSASESAPAPAPAPDALVSVETTEPRIPPGWSVPSMLEAVQR